jgi:hypothetical protein
LTAADVKVRADYRAAKFAAFTKQLEEEVFGRQAHCEITSDGIPMSLESYKTLCSVTHIGDGDKITEVGPGSYPRVALYSAALTGKPILAFDPNKEVFEHFNLTVMASRYADKSEQLRWKYPRIARDNATTTVGIQTRSKSSRRNNSTIGSTSGSSYSGSSTRASNSGSTNVNMNTGDANDVVDNPDLQHSQEYSSQYSKDDEDQEDPDFQESQLTQESSQSSYDMSQ